ncbi:unnamed protein product, partial [Brenthis ino]
MHPLNLFLNQSKNCDCPVRKWPNITESGRRGGKWRRVSRACSAPSESNVTSALVMGIILNPSNKILLYNYNL